METRARRKHLCSSCALLEKPKPIRKCPECIKIKSRSWHAENTDKVRAWKKAYKERDPVHFKELKKKSSKRYRERHREKVAMDKYLWAHSNPIKNWNKNKRWRLNNREVYLQGRADLYSRRNFGDFWECHKAKKQLSQEIKTMKEDDKNE